MLKASAAALDFTNATVATRAAQSELDVANAAVNVAYANIDALGTSLNNGYSTLEASLLLQADQTALDATNATGATKDCRAK